MSENTQTNQYPKYFWQWLMTQLGDDSDEPGYGAPERLRELAENGADAGWPGLTYTSECVQVFDHYADEIWSMLAEDAEDMGLSVAALIATFRRQDMTNDFDQFRNLLLWYAAERYASKNAE